MPKISLKSQKGFTLIELLVVIGILAVLMAIVLIAINPARQFAQANNTKRRADINALLNGIHQYAADNKGALPAGLASLDHGVAYTIENGATNADICAALMPTYLSSLPTDPTLNAQPISSCTGAYNTGYQVIYGSATDATNRRVTVLAPSADLTVEPAGTQDISVTR
jgi:prepilin-type N-terminal cleavage/methylation domain-containing protein